MPSPNTKTFFLPVHEEQDDQRFCIYHPALGGTTRGSVLYVHPFAEEMNKSRRMAALQARELARSGFAVFQMDLLGCGDSSGDFGDATWQAWVADVVRGCHWLRKRSTAPLWLWGLRAGCLLAAEAARQIDTPCNFIFWAPSPFGRSQLQQFLRLKAAGDMLGGGAKGVTDGLRQQLATGTVVDIAGYMISPGLAQGMEQSVLAPPNTLRSSAIAARVEWFDISTRVDAVLSPVAQKAIAQWEQSGFAVRSRVVQGPSFWQTTEIEEAPSLILATMSALDTKAASHVLDTSN